MASRRTGKSSVAEAPDVRVTARARSPIGPAGAARLALAVVRAERAHVAALSIAFVGPARMRSLNREHLGHDYVTDVITFSMKAGNGERGTGKRLASYRPVPRAPFPVVADIYICPAFAARQAREHGTTARDEVRRLVVHGILHALGYDHPAGERRTASPMWRRQERYLRRFGALAA